MSNERLERAIREYKKALLAFQGALLLYGKWEDVYEAGRQEGIKTVVDWMEPRLGMFCGLITTNIDWIEWQAKLKEWNIKEDECQKH